MGDYLRKGKRFSAEEIAAVKRLASSQNLFRREIAEKTGMDLKRVQHIMRKLGIYYRAKARYGEWNIKHKHLREPVMRYFLNHSAQETADHFGLTRSEVKSIFTIGYRDPKFKHLRKEWRPHSAWTTKDWLFMCRSVGIQPRKWIGKKLKRGNTYNSVKDALAKFRGYGKYMNGMPWGWAQEFFGLEAEKYSIKTKAGPTGGGGNKRGDFRYRIIPWVICEQLASRGEFKPILGKGKVRPERKARAPRIHVDPAVVSGIRSMAKFQRWIHGTESDQVVVRRIRKILKQR